MFEIAGISMLLISLIAVLALAVVTALRMRRLATRISSLRSHPMLDPEWLSRKRAVLISLAEDAQRMRTGFTRLKAAFDAIARDFDELTIAVVAMAGAVEEILDTTAPWLRGLFAVRSDER
jgi:hypothetical protein